MLATTAAARPRRAEAYGYDPARWALCTCGQGFKAPGLRALNAQIEAHMADATEGCDHAVQTGEQGEP